MAVNDPSNLLQRIPELRALADDPKIRRAIESGDPFKVYRALAWAKWLRRLPAQRDVIDALVRNRRFFAKPLAGTPALGSINSFGFGFVGKMEEERDGTYIAMHALVVLYMIPIIPLRSYLVSKADSSAFSSSWHIFARVPSSMAGWLYTRGLALGLVALVGYGAVSSVISARTQDVVLVNGFDAPVKVVLDGSETTVAPMGHATVTVQTGEVRGKASIKGRTVDTLQQKISSSGSHTFWNIAGAAPVFQENVQYVKTDPGKTAPATDETVYCGRQFFEIGRVDDLFAAPPKSVSGSKYDTQIARVHVDVATTEGQPGYASCAYYLVTHGRAKHASGFMEAVGELKGWDDQSMNLAMVAAIDASPAHAVRVARRVLAARPDEVGVHRNYQHAREEAGDSAALLEEYAQMARQQPDSPMAQYLYAVLARGRPGLDAMEKLGKRFSRDPEVLRSLAWRRMTHGDYAGATQVWQRLQAISPASAADVADAQVRALVAMHHAGDAASLLTGILNDPKGENKTTHLGEFLMVAKIAGMDPSGLLASLSKPEGSAAWLDPVRVRAGMDPVQSADKRSPAVQVMLALRDDPAGAVRRATSLGWGDLAGFGPEQWALLYGEAVRSRQDAVIAYLERGKVHVGAADRGIFKRYVRGEAADLDDTDLEPGMRAAAMLVRSRNAALPAAERAQLRARAAETDLLHSTVTSALRGWSA